MFKELKYKQEEAIESFVSGKDIIAPPMGYLSLMLLNLRDLILQTSTNPSEEQADLLLVNDHNTWLCLACKLKLHDYNPQCTCTGGVITVVCVSVATNCSTRYVYTLKARYYWILREL